MTMSCLAMVSAISFACEDYAHYMMDIEEYINYQIMEIFADNVIWLDQNVRMWRERKEDKKARQQDHKCQNGVTLDASRRFGPWLDIILSINLKDSRTRYVFRSSDRTPEMTARSVLDENPFLTFNDHPVVENLGILGVPAHEGEVTENVDLARCPL